MAKNTQSSAKVSGSIGLTNGHVAELLRYEANPKTGNATPAEQLAHATKLLALVANGQLTPEALYHNAYNAGMDIISTADCPRL